MAILVWGWIKKKLKRARKKKKNENRDKWENEWSDVDSSRKNPVSFV